MVPYWLTNYNMNPTSLWTCLNVTVLKNLVLDFNEQATLNEGDDSFVSQAEMVTLTLCEETNKLSSYIDINDFLSAC